MWNVQLLRSILVFLDTRSWAAPAVGSSSETRKEMTDDMAEIREAVEHVISVFREPLEAKGACLSSLDDELEEAVQFCRRYLNSQLEDLQESVVQAPFHPRLTEMADSASSQ